MDVKNKPGCKCCSPCAFTCSGAFPEIEGFVLSASSITSYTDDGDDCHPCYWNLTLPLDDTIDSLSDPDLQLDTTCCNFRRNYTSPCCEFEHEVVSTTDTGWQYLNPTTERRTVSYFCSKVYVVQRVTVSIRASMCEAFDGFVFTNELNLIVSYKWEFSFRYAGYGQSIQYTRPTGGGAESVFFWTHLPADSFVGPINTCSALRSYTSDFLVANTDCLCFPDFPPYTTYKDDLDPCEDADFDFFVERIYRIDFVNDPVVIGDCCELIGTYPLVFAGIITNASGFGMTVTQTPTESLPGIYNLRGVVTLKEPCIASGQAIELYGTGGCGCTDECTYIWDGSNWSLLTDDCCGSNTCAGLPSAPGDAPGDTLSFPCLP